MTGHKHWTDERRWELKKLKRTGLSLSKIAAVMNLTRSTVAGQLWRDRNRNDGCWGGLHS